MEGTRAYLITGIYKINKLDQKEYHLTLQTWSAVTGLQGPDLRNWVTQTVLPSLPLFLEWRDGCLSQEEKPPAVIHQDMMQSMSDDLCWRTFSFGTEHGGTGCFCTRRAGGYMTLSTFQRTGNNHPGDNVGVCSHPVSRMRPPEDDKAANASPVAPLFASRAPKTIIQRRKQEDI